MMQRMTEQPMLRWASSCAPEPRLMLTKAQQPSPIMTASASATTVSGETTVLAALPLTAPSEPVSSYIAATASLSRPSSIVTS